MIRYKSKKRKPFPEGWFLFYMGGGYCITSLKLKRSDPLVTLSV